MQKIGLITAFIAVTAFPAFSEENPADAILGQWYSDGSESIVEVTLDDKKKFAGKIIWLSEPLYEKGHEHEGKPKRDLNNSDKKNHKNPILGLAMLNGFKYDSKDKEWNTGKIYDPNNGRTYKCVIKLGEKNDDDMQQLKVRGYVGIPTLGRTTIWTRVPEDKLIKSDKNETEKAVE